MYNAPNLSCKIDNKFLYANSGTQKTPKFSMKAFFDRNNALVRVFFYL